MDQEGKNETLLRKYLLGELNEADEHGLEAEFLADEELSELLLAEEDELVDDYLSGVLSAEDRERFDRNFMVTPERQRKLRFGEALRRRYPPQVVKNPDLEDPRQDLVREDLGASERTATDTGAREPVSKLEPTVVGTASPVVIGPPTWWRRASSSPYLRAAAAVIVLAVGLGVWRAFIYQSEVEKGMAALAQAYKNERLTEVRISGLSYASVSNTRGRGRGSVDEFSRSRAALILRNEVAEHPSSTAHHALGRFYLAGREYKEAIDQFEEALNDAPNDAQLHNDYGAALLEMGVADEAEGRSAASPEKFDKAVEHLNRAIELDKSYLEPLFNLALCRQKMKLFQQAEVAWQRYLERDATSKWADEARQNLNAIEEQR